MAEFDWYKLKFLESGGNLKPLIKACIGRTPSTSVTREVAVCLQQGRLFYEAAASSPLEIRPLQLFYGMVGFAKALALTRTLRSLSTLRHSHGLIDISAQDSRLADLKVRIGAQGTFQEFNDAVSKLNRICYFGKSATPLSIYVPSASSRELDGSELTIKGILSRIPGLESLYKSTFQEDPNTGNLMLHFWAEYDDYCDIRIDDPELYSDRSSLRAIVEKWRARYPFLRNWCLVSAAHAWGYSVIKFGNVDNSQIDEFAEEHLIQANNEFRTKKDPMHDSTVKRIKFSSLLSPLAGGFSEGGPSAIAPFDGVYLSEFSLHYLGMYLLSSLVRYRPHTWGHAISRATMSNMPADDQMLALIERFMEVSFTAFPAMMVKAINPYEDKYR